MHLLLFSVGWIRGERGERKEGKEASGKEEQDEGLFPIFPSGLSVDNLTALICKNVEIFRIE